MDFGRIWEGYRIVGVLMEQSTLMEMISDQNLQYFTPVVGVNFNKFVVAYTYSYQTGNIRLQSGGFHQITLGYNFFDRKYVNWEQDMRYNGMLRPNVR